MTRCGLIQVGDPEGELVQGVLKSATEHQLEVEEWTAAQTMEKFPLLKLPAEHTTIYERGAGFLRVERCVATLVKLASELGAEMLLNSPVGSWAMEDEGTIRVSAGEGEEFLTRRLIVSAGAWSEPLLGLSLGLKVIRKQQHWFQLDRIEQKLGNGFPCFLMEMGDRCFYGFPEIDYLGMKVAEHTGGTEVADPATIDRTRDSGDTAAVESFLDDRFEFTRKRLVYDSVCMYTESPDQHFIVDQHPQHPQVAFVAGLSGHGFKFAPVLGRHLVDRLEGKQDPLFDFLQIRS